MKAKTKFSSHWTEQGRIQTEKHSQLPEQFKHILKIRSRIHKILDDQFNWIYGMAQRQNVSKPFSNPIKTQNQVIINESRLEEWVEMFRHQILTIKSLNATYQKEKSPLNIPLIELPQPFVENATDRFLCHVQDNSLKVFQHIWDKNDSEEAWKQTPYQFPQGFMKKHSSVTQISDQHELIIIGGCKSTNPNVKSSKILSLNLATSELKTLANLPYGLSSHSVVYHKVSNSIYIIGGNKNHSIVTRGCFRLNLGNCKVEEIACLNYPVSSANCISWGNDWIYKFGGVGQAFGEWNTSPYIERYSIELNQWQLVNPSIGPRVHQNVSFQNMFLAHSNSYICSDPNKIFVFGGYSIEGQFKNYGFVLRIDHSSESDLDDADTHVIEECGKIQTENFSRGNRKILLAQNSSKQICLISLAHNESSKILQPAIIRKFGK